MKKNGVIYEPKGRAREYCPLALNIYRGCGHGCTYCFGPSTIKVTRTKFHGNPTPRKDILKKALKEIPLFSGNAEPIQLCFTCDPYQPIETTHQITRQILDAMLKHDVSCQILTKGGMRAARDFDILAKMREPSFGTTLVFTDDADRKTWEPDAASVDDRIEAVKLAKSKGIRTWVSMEPVIDPVQALELIDMLHPYVDNWKVGPINYDKNTSGKVNWKKFLVDVETKLKSYGANYYLKDALYEKAGVPIPVR